MTPNHNAKGDLVIREFGEETLILDPETDRIHQLNSTAALVWRRAVGGASIDTIAAALVAEYDLSDTRARRDVDTALQQFRDLGLFAAES